MVKEFIKLIRVKQWVKNGFIFFPAFFASELFREGVLIDLIFGFFAYSLTASAVYVMNDWFDASVDRLHPQKKDRPIASGKINTSQVLQYVVLLFMFGFAISIAVDVRFSMLLMVYFGVNLVYSAGIKNFPVIDVAIVSFGFILRILAGGEIADVPISKWMIIVTFCLSMFLAFAKRRNDLLIYERTGQQTRKAIQRYNNPLINISLIVTSIATIAFYFLYTISESAVERIDDKLFITTIFVVFGLARYFYLTFKKNLSGKPTEVLFSDRILQLIILCWVGSFAWFIYA